MQNPTPEQRPDLYDYYDNRDLPIGYKTGVRVPDRIQKLIDEKIKRDQIKRQPPEPSE